MNVLGIESSCDETGVALYRISHDSASNAISNGLLAHALHSQIALHRAYGGVVPELASRDHIQRVLPLLTQVLHDAQLTRHDIDLIAFTHGPGLSGALLVGASVANALGYALKVPTLGVHHLEGHLLSPLLSNDPPTFPFVALLVSGGHTQLMWVADVGEYTLLGETLDDAAGEAFDKTAKLLGMGYPGGADLSRLAQRGQAGRFSLPRPMLHSGDLDFSFSGLKTAVLVHTQKLHAQNQFDAVAKQDLAAEFQAAIVDVLSHKCHKAMQQMTWGTHSPRLVVAGGVGANQQLRQRLAELAHKHGYHLHFPEFEWCTDNGAMIALAGALRWQKQQQQDATHIATDTDPFSAHPYAFSVKPRLPLI
jgi:N6-L-threonylcarbamoyladenine synthase